MTPEALPAAATGLAVFGWSVYQYSVARELAQTRRETSRFPLFEARDALVQLIADQQMEETDPAWESLYRTVTLLLHLNDRRLNFLDCVSMHMQYLTLIATDPKLKDRLNEEVAVEEERARSVPAFGDVRRKVHVALKHMIDRRTKPWHRTLAMLIVVGPKLAELAVVQDVKTAKSVGASLRLHPSPDDIAGWSLVLKDRTGARAA